MRIDFSPECDGDSFANVIAKLAGISVEIVLNDRENAGDYINGIILGAGTDGMSVTLTDSEGTPLTINDLGYHKRERFPWQNIETVRYV